MLKLVDRYPLTIKSLGLVFFIAGMNLLAYGCTATPTPKTVVTDVTIGLDVLQEGCVMTEAFLGVTTPAAVATACGIENLVDAVAKKLETIAGAQKAAAAVKLAEAQAASKK